MTGLFFDRNFGDRTLDSSVRIETIKNVPAQTVAFRETRVVEVAGGFVNHADLFHDAAGAEIRRCGEGDEAAKPQPLKGKMDHGPRAFGGKALAPVVVGETPADFDRGHEGRF